ncbi:MAG: hypothetical protein WCI02_08335 [Planctomycetota bacterium]
MRTPPHHGFGWVGRARLPGADINGVEHPLKGWLFFWHPWVLIPLGARLGCDSRLAIAGQVPSNTDTV